MAVPAPGGARAPVLKEKPRRSHAPLVQPRIVHAPKRRTARRGHLFGDDGSEGLEDGGGQIVAHQHPAPSRGGMERFQNAARLRPHLDGPETPLVVGNFRTQHALDRVDRIRIGVVVGHVHGAVDLGRGACIVDHQGISGFLYPRPHPNRLRQAVGFDFRGVFPIGQAKQGVAHGFFRAALNLFGQRAQIIQAIFFQEIAQALFRQAVRRELGVDVAHHQIGHAHVVANEVDERLIRLAAPVHLHHGNLEALFVDLPGVGGADFPADVRQMGRTG